MEGIVALSKAAKKIYTFDGRFKRWGRDDLSIIDIVDSKGDYRRDVLARWLSPKSNGRQW